MGCGRERHEYGGAVRELELKVKLKLKHPAKPIRIRVTFSWHLDGSDDYG